MSFKKFFNVVYDDRGRRHWKTVNEEEKPPSPSEKKTKLPIDYSKALEARPENSLSTQKIGQKKLDKKTQDLLGYHCRTCNFSAKDNHSWLDHLNSVEHNRNLGNHMKVEKVTPDVVEEHLRSLKNKKSKKPAPKIEDILKRLEGEPQKKMKLKED